MRCAYLAEVSVGLLSLSWEGGQKMVGQRDPETQETQERWGKTLRSLRTVNYWWGIRAMLWKGHQALRTFVLCCSLAGCRPRTLSMTAHENGLHLAWVVLYSLNSDTPIGKNCEGMLRPNIAYNGSFNLLSRFFTLAFCSLLPIPCLKCNGAFLYACSSSLTFQIRKAPILLMHLLPG